MKRFLPSILLMLSGVFSLSASTYRHVSYSHPKPFSSTEEKAEETDTLPVRSLEELLIEIVPDAGVPDINLFSMPKIFFGYRDIQRPKRFTLSDSLTSPALFKELYFRELPDTIERVVYSASASEDNPWDLADLPSQRDSMIVKEVVVKGPLPSVVTGKVIPDWLSRYGEAWDNQLDILYSSMIYFPNQANYAFWSLPVPPSMPKEDYSYMSFLKKLNIKVNVDDAVVPEEVIGKKHWLHLVNAGLQFSQAYLSKNWYQGGNNYLALLGNFLWDVQLNPVYHPNMIFQSTVSYKLGLNSTEKTALHKYSISEDLFQYNLKFGYLAAGHWYYSFTTQFKTQFLNNYPSDSWEKTASFLTPGNLTLGLGMTYTYQNPKKTLNFSASISPLSYNLKTAINTKVDHTQFGMEQTQKTLHEFGSTAEVNFSWKFLDNVFYRTRLFLFTDYKESNADWQNTLEIQFNKFFSTQLYINLRYDSTADRSLDPRWSRWMMKEILSLGLSYTFSTKI